MLIYIGYYAQHGIRKQGSIINFMLLTLSNEQTAAEFFDLPSFALFIAFILVSCPFKIEIFLSN